MRAAPERVTAAVLQNPIGLSDNRDACATSMLILPGNDLYHPAVSWRQIADLAPNAELIEPSKERDVVRQGVERVQHFFVAHTPA
jgi:hypothetical protein